MSDNPEPAESKVKIFSQEVSFRGLLALILILTLSGLTIFHPDLFAKAFESIAIAVVAFYFGQNSKK